MMGLNSGRSGVPPRRVFYRAMFLLAVTTLGLRALAQTPAAPAVTKPPTPKATDPVAQPVLDVAPPGKTVLLWTQGAPKAVGKTAADVPTLTI